MSSVHHFERIQRLDTLHAFRALLRAVSYLPDSFARTYFHKLVVRRFQSKKSRPRRPQTKQVAHQQKQRIHRAWQVARRLERASNDSIGDLNKVLLHAYGRIGPRKWQLVNTLLLPEESSLPQDDSAVEQLAQNVPTNPPKLDFERNSKLIAFIKSAQRNYSPESPKAKVRTLRLPEENAWGRPIPRKRELSLKKKWWASTLDRFLPPVPESEWNRLRDFAMGLVPLEKPPQRRKAVTPCKTLRPLSKKWEAKEDDRNKEILDIFTLPYKAADSNVELGFDPNVGLVPREQNSSMVSQSPFPSRTLRRLYARIWSLTPKMSQDETTKGWNINWGPPYARDPQRQTTMPSARDLELFEGMENFLIVQKTNVTKARWRRTSTKEDTNGTWMRDKHGKRVFKPNS